jgi:predicted nucleic-acid-binding protein
MRAVDSNVLIRLIARDEARQTASAEAFISDGAWVSILALAEAVWVLRSVYQRNAEELVDIVEVLLDNQDLILQDADAVAEALKVFRQRPTLGFADCLLVELARKAGHLPLGTFDRALGKVAGTQKI